MNRTNLVRQHDEKDCGAACLGMVLAHHGRRVALSKLRQAVKIDKDGANIYGIMDGAGRFNMSAEAYGGSAEDAWESISEGAYSFPFILRILNDCVYEHFVVATGMHNGKLSILDPAKGKRELREGEFTEDFLGQLITFAPDKDFECKNERKSEYSRYLELITRQKGLLISALLLSIMIMGIGMSGMYLFRYILDSVLSNLSSAHQLEESVETLCLLIFMIGLLHILKYGLTVLRSRMMAWLSKRIDIPLMLGYYNHVTNLPLSFFNTLKTGEIMSRFEDAAKIRDAVSGSMVTITLDSFMVIGCGIALYLQSALMFRYALVIFLIYLLIAFLFIKPLARSNEEVMVQSAVLTSYLKESIDGIETVKSTRSEEAVQDKAEGIYLDLVKKSIKNVLLNTHKEALIDLVSSIGTLSILWAGTMQVIAGVITAGALITFTSLMSCFLEPVQDLVQLQGNIQAAVVAADRLNDILAAEEEHPEGKSFDEGIKSIEFDHVDFRYGNRGLVLKNFSMQVSEGQRVGLIGESGCGKSTAAKLIMGLYTPENGHILINGTDAGSCSIDYLRKQIAYVPQSTYLFSGSVRDNLLMGAHDTNWTDSDLEHILDICQCQFIKGLPLGIDSEIEENGTNFSGGQKQRMAIARALLGNPSVLILDESTSALDAVSEYRLLKGIQTNYPQLSIITVTHRIRSVMDYDKIYVIEDGEVTESGCHRELLSSSTKYADLWNIQQAYYQKDVS